MPRRRLGVEGDDRVWVVSGDRLGELVLLDGLLSGERHKGFPLDLQVGEDEMEGSLVQRGCSLFIGVDLKHGAEVRQEVRLSGPELLLAAAVVLVDEDSQHAADGLQSWMLGKLVAVGEDARHDVGVSHEVSHGLDVGDVGERRSERRLDLLELAALPGQRLGAVDAAEVAGLEEHQHLLLEDELGLLVLDDGEILESLLNLGDEKESQEVVLEQTKIKTVLVPLLLCFLQVLKLGHGGQDPHVFHLLHIGGIAEHVKEELDGDAW